MEKEGKSDGDNWSTIKVNVKFNGRSIPVEISDESTVKHLKSVLQPLTNVLSRGQKLIFKGKVLVDEMTLKSSKLEMVLRSCLWLPRAYTKGRESFETTALPIKVEDGPIRKEASTLPTVRRMPEAMRPKRDVPQVPVVKSQLERWKATGVVALSECNLKGLPETAALPTKVEVDLSSNLLVLLPETISKLKDLKALYLKNKGLKSLPSSIF